MLTIVIMLLIGAVCLYAYKVEGKQRAIESALIYLVLLSICTLVTVVAGMVQDTVHLIIASVILSIFIFVLSDRSLTQVKQNITNMYKSLRDEGVQKM